MRKFFILFVLVSLLLACRRETVVIDKSPSAPPNSPVPPNLPPADGLPVNVNLNAAQTGSVIPANFEGLSYETGILADSPDILNENNLVLVQLIKNLGPGILRIGGDTSDEVFWTGGARSPSTGTDSLTTSDIDRLSAFSRATGWPVLFGLNLGSYHPDVAANEAQYVENSLQDNLYSLVLGNEPDVYHLFGLRNANYVSASFMPEWEAYRGTILSLVPNASFCGPGIAYQTSWIPDFANHEHSNVKLLDTHYYLTGPASSPSINYHTILSKDEKLLSLLSVIDDASSQYHLTYRVSECNNVYGGGKAGVSDVFASALWALDFMWTVAQNDGQGINFHGGNGLFYSPISIENGVITARPEYYAMLAFKYGNTGGTMIASSTDQPGYSCSVYACANADKTYSVTLINEDENNNLSFNIKSAKTVSTVDVLRLTAPSMTSATGTMLGGSTVNANGTFKPSADEYTANAKSFVLNVPAGSAAVVTMH